jgi:diguanylate cyclase (GGDEF)-like protein
MAEEAMAARKERSLQTMLDQLKKRKGLERKGYPGNPEVLERVRKFEQTDALNTEEAHKAAAKGDDLERLTVLDAVTELYNHTTIVKELRAELKRGTRYQHPVSVCLLTIDGFGSISQDYGTLTGDAVLRVATSVIRSGVREVDMVGRYGEDQFLIVFPQTSGAGATLVADRVRQRIAHQAIMYNWQCFSVTASAGVSTFPEHGQECDELIARALEAMEHAIARGGDRVLTV